MVVDRSRPCHLPLLPIFCCVREKDLTLIKLSINNIIVD
ncbi:hypothetical protein RKLH11_2755 [Rhodobacteraceae bacterium KLH11]|nr:hypothetical protein RKLH11_2755 [Rhodobacteraceae bacterium KLH11]